MKFITLLFAVLASVPQALKWFAYELYKFNKCVPGAEKCMVGDNDQGGLLGMLYHPNWFTTTGLWIGLAGTVVGFAGMYAMELYNRKKVDELIDVAHDTKKRNQREQRERGRMPRPTYGQRQDSGRSDPRSDRYDDRNYDRDSRHQQDYRRPPRDRYDDDDYYDDDRPRPRGRR